MSLIQKVLNAQKACKKKRLQATSLGCALWQIIKSLLRVACSAFTMMGMTNLFDCQEKATRKSNQVQYVHIVVPKLALRPGNYLEVSLTFKNACKQTKLMLAVPSELERCQVTTHFSAFLLRTLSGRPLRTGFSCIFM